MKEKPYSLDHLLPETCHYNILVSHLLQSNEVKERHRSRRRIWWNKNYYFRYCKIFRWTLSHILGHIRWRNYALHEKWDCKNWMKLQVETERVCTLKEVSWKQVFVPVATVQRKGRERYKKVISFCVKTHHFDGDTHFLSSTFSSPFANEIALSWLSKKKSGHGRKEREGRKNEWVG